jgi:two-component system, LytTR family, sensor kinase
MKKQHWFQRPLPRLAQHLAFWVLSFFVFLQLFKEDGPAQKIDYIYTALFHFSLLPAVYINLSVLFPRLVNARRWPLYLLAVVALIAVFTWLNDGFFQDWSTYLLPGYFFISYFTWWETSLFYVVYLSVTSLLKLSKSWFAISELQRRLLETEKEKVQIELKALKAQVNPHFFFNTLNGIYSMSLARDERLPATILQLSQLMRYFLYESTADLVSLEKEWQVFQDYIALQKIRSTSNLNLQQEVEGEIRDQQIAPLLLVTFLENAFKHGAPAGNETSYIRIFLQVLEKDFNFRIENTKGQVDDVEPGIWKGMGLENVRRRLSLLYPGKHSLDISDQDDRFVVQLHLQL